MSNIEFNNEKMVADFDTIDCDDVFLESNLDSKKSFENSSLNFEEMSNCLLNLIDNQSDCKNVKNFDNIINDYDNNQCDFSFF
jgi:hypothetical protein